MTTSKTIYFTMVATFAGGWMRVGNAYGSKETADGWLDFISRAHGDRKTKVEPCCLIYVDGKLDAETIKRLDEKFNIEA